MTVLANRFSRRRFLERAAGLTALAVAAGTVAGCAGPGGESGPKAVVKLDPNVKASISTSVWGMPWENDLYTKYYIPDFQKKYPNIKVEFNHFENYRDKIISLHAGGQMVDVPRLGMAWVWEFIDKKMLVPLEDYIKTEGLDKADFHPATWPPISKDGKAYAIPQDLNFTGLYFNKTPFEKEGLALPNHEYTLDRLTEDAKRMTKKDASGRVQQYGFIRIWSASTGFWTLVYALGGKFWNEDRTKCLYDSPEVVEALEWQRKLCVDLQAAPTNAEMGAMGYAGMTDVLFQEGKAVMLQEGTHRSPSVQKNAPQGFKFAVTSHPKGKEKKIASAGQSFGVSSQSKAHDAAYLLNSFMNNSENLVKYWIFTWVAPPARFSSLRSPDFKKIVGIPGTVPGLTGGDEEFNDKCGWIPYSIEKEGFIQTEWVSPWFGTWQREGQAAIDAVLVPGSTVKAADVLKTAATNVNKYIQEQLKK